jgi:hypothetical protein
LGPLGRSEFLVLQYGRFNKFTDKSVPFQSLVGIESLLGIASPLGIEFFGVVSLPGPRLFFTGQ